MATRKKAVATKQLNLRLPLRLHRKLKEVMKGSLNEEIVQRLNWSLMISSFEEDQIAAHDLMQNASAISTEAASMLARASSLYEEASKMKAQFSDEARALAERFGKGEGK